MILKNNEIGLYIDIADVLITQIEMIGCQHYPNEFGGILLGKYSNDRKTVVVSNTILPMTYKSAKYSFERGSEGLKEQLISYYNDPEQLMYVGEWHTHPDGRPFPSGTDIRALKQIVNDDNVYICSPIMVILGLTRDASEFGFYVYFKDKIYRYETF